MIDSFEASPATPFLAIDPALLERNLRAMADSARARGLALRPHAKTHKIEALGLRQLELGAVGLTVATVGEAEVFAAAGVQDLFLAYPLWADAGKGRRLRALADHVALTVGIDSAAGARQLAAATSGAVVRVLVEVDSGHHRTGVAPSDAGQVAVAAAEAGLDVQGVFTFPGHGYGPGRRDAAAADEARALTEAVAALARVGIRAAVVSGGSTPTAAAADVDVLTEVRPGVYVFNDAQQVEMGTCGWNDVALWAVATVVSRSGATVVLDAGSKTLGADWPAWVSGGGRLPDHPEARVTALSEHHASVEFPRGAQLPKLGELLRVVPNHVCAAVNLADEVVLLADGVAADVWRISARGRNS